MTSPQERAVTLARSQVGYVPPRGKFNKYAEALDATDLYNYAKNGYDWCDIFYDWLLVEEFGVELAKAMTNQPSKGCGAGCDWSASYYRAANQWSRDPSLGAQVFFGSRGDEHHTSIVVGFDGAHVHTVEGNTGYGVGYSVGAVLERTYGRDDSRITGYGVPRWSMAGGHEPIADVTNAYEDKGELEVDGWLGVQSVTAWQRALGTHADGFVSSSRTFRDGRLAYQWVLLSWQNDFWRLANIKHCSSVIVGIAAGRPVGAIWGGSKSGSNMPVLGVSNRFQLLCHYNKNTPIYLRFSFCFVSFGYLWLLS